MSNEAHRYERGGTFSVVPLLESFSYVKGDLFRPYLCDKPFDRGIHFDRADVKACFPKKYRSVEAALAAIRRAMDPVPHESRSYG